MKWPQLIHQKWHRLTCGLLDTFLVTDPPDVALIIRQTSDAMVAIYYGSGFAMDLPELGAAKTMDW